VRASAAAIEQQLQNDMEKAPEGALSRSLAKSSFA
jgi:hypothetical protein